MLFEHKVLAIPYYWTEAVVRVRFFLKERFRVPAPAVRSDVQAPIVVMPVAPAPNSNLVAFSSKTNGNSSTCLHCNLTNLVAVFYVISSAQGRASSICEKRSFSRAWRSSTSPQLRRHVVRGSRQLHRAILFLSAITALMCN